MKFLDGTPAPKSYSEPLAKLLSEAADGDPGELGEISELVENKVSFNERCNCDPFNLVFSYSATEDHKAVTLGYDFLGGAIDQNGKEVHVFQMKKLTL
jgi:hypothetical protein